MDDLTTMMVEKQPFTDLKVLSAKFDKALIFGKDGSITSKPVLEAELEVEGRKRPVRRSVIYGFCPFCGKPYEPKTPAESEVANG